MWNETTEIKRKNDYSTLFTYGRKYDHVQTAEEGKEFIQAYGEALLKRSSGYIVGLAAALSIMVIIIVAAFVSGAVWELDDLSFEIFDFFICIIPFFLITRISVHSKNKKLAKGLLDPALLEGLEEEEIIRRANNAIDAYNKQYQGDYLEEEMPQNKSESDKATDNVDRMPNMDLSDNRQKGGGIIMLNGEPVPLDDGNRLNGKKGKRRNPTLSRGRIGLIIGIISAALFVGAIIVDQTTLEHDGTEDLYYSEEDTSETEETETPVPVSDDAEKALETAEEYAQMDMSKAMIYDKLTRGLGDLFTNYERFTEEAAQYAVDHLECDWNENAVGMAESIDSFKYYSEATMRDELINQGGFTEESADYAIEHANIDWNENALGRAKFYKRIYQENDLIYEMLTSDTEQFTPEQAQYAIDHLDKE